MGGGGQSAPAAPPAPDPYAQDRIDQKARRDAYEKERQDIYIPKTKEMLASSDDQLNKWYSMVNQYYRDSNKVRETPITTTSVPDAKKGLGV